MNPHWHIIIISKAIVGVAYAISFHKCIMTYINHYRYLFWIFIYLALGLSCPTACGILVPWLGISPMSPTLQGGLFPTGPPWESWVPFISLLCLIALANYVCLNNFFFLDVISNTSSLWKVNVNYNALFQKYFLYFHLVSVNSLLGLLWHNSGKRFGVLCYS